VVVLVVVLLYEGERCNSPPTGTRKVIAFLTPSTPVVAKGTGEGDYYSYSTWYGDIGEEETSKHTRYEKEW